MLTRAARRRQALRFARDAAEQIQLPFLCPAIRFPHIAANQQRPIASRPLSRSRTLLPAIQARQLASAAPLPESFDRNDDYAPYLQPREYNQTRFHRNDLSTLPDWDPSFRNLIHLEATTATQPERINTNVSTGADMRGNSREVESNLDACLLLKKWPRALSNLAQLKILYSTDSDRLRTQFNYVLAYMVDDLIDSHTSDVEQIITQWIEKDMRQAGLDPNAQTFALVIKAALAVPTKSKRDRTVRRYWEMAKRYELQGEVGSLRSILSERDLGLISQICPLEALQYSDFASDSRMPEEPEILLSENIVSQRPELDIRETEQKGQGMTALRQTLSLFHDEKDQERTQVHLSTEEAELYAQERQARLERDVIASATERWKKEHEKMARMGITAGLNSGRMGVLLWQWHEILRDKIVAELQKVKEAENAPKKNAQDRARLQYGPFMQQLEPDKLAAVTAIAMMQIMNKSGAGKPIKLVRLVTELGKIVESEHHAERLYQRTLKWNKKRRQGYSMAEIVKDLTENPERPDHWGVTTRGSHPAGQKFLLFSEWTTSIHVKLGAILCEMFMDAAKITLKHTNEGTGKTMSIAQPIFQRQTVFSNGKKVGIVSLHSSFVKYLLREPSCDLVSKQLPMVCKPLPWKGFHNGGYLQSHVPALRVKHREMLQKDYAIAAASNGDLDQVLAGLDVLGKVPWKINKEVFRVMAEAWNSGNALANLSPINRHFDIPERPAADAPPRTKHEWFSRMREIDNQRSGDHSNRCFQNFQMEIAKAYINETFYLPHNMDFRGRAYPVPPYLNQMGADNARGLLMFANGRKLGKNGLRWLKIHLSNVYGYDKASLSDREQFPMTHIQEIRDSVLNPLDGNKWWLQAEDPWQCLATCHELVAALDSPNHEEFESHLPVHQDGSCNGLQHYAALGGDIAGARQVNLEPGDKPADVYTGVCELVAAEVAEDAARGHDMAKLLDGRLKRKIVKQTVMTNVYGVTFMGASAQVRKQIDNLLPDLLEARLSGKAALYLAEKIFKALGTLFTGAHEIQYWLGDCANRISSSVSPAQMQQIMKAETRVPEPNPRPGRRKAVRSAKKTTSDTVDFRSSVIWTTPLKLPVVQPYRKAKGQQIQTNLQSITLYEPTIADSVHKRKQLQAFPPNFIHSLDATHMILSALKSDELGLTFTAVHDSFWTHAADVDTMGEVLRDAFIRMHSEDIVGRLAAEFQKRYEGHVYMGTVTRTSKLGIALRDYRREYASVLGATSKNAKALQKAELIREIKRNRLLASEDPAERKEGEEMVTASSLYEQYGGDKYLVSQDSLGQTAMGTVPAAPQKAMIEQALHSGAEVDVDVGRVLDPLVEHDDHEEHGHDADAEVTATGEGPVAGAKAAKKAKKATSASNNQTWLWLPLQFRAVPKKGEFDVRRLKHSQYFFS